MKATVPGVLEDLTFKISEGSDQNWSWALRSSNSPETVAFTDLDTLKSRKILNHLKYILHTYEACELKFLFSWLKCTYMIDLYQTSKVLSRFWQGFGKFLASFWQVFGKVFARFGTDLGKVWMISVNGQPLGNPLGNRLAKYNLKNVLQLLSLVQSLM